MQRTKTKLLLLLASTMFLCEKSLAQTLSPEDSLHRHYFSPISNSYNCVKRPGSPYKVISEDAIRTMLRRDFSYLVLNRDQSSATAGTGFTLDINSDKTVATYNFAFVNGGSRRLINNVMSTPPAKWIVSASVTAGYSNAIGALFSNTKANPKAGITGKFSYILSAGPSGDISYCSQVVPATKAYISLLTTKGQLELLNYSQLNTELTAQQSSLTTFRQAFTGLSATASTPAKTNLLDSIKKYEEKVAGILRLLSEPPVHALAVFSRLNDTLISYELKNVKWMKQTIIWVDGTVGFNIGSYNLFDDVNTFQNQDTSVSQKTYGIAIQGITNWTKRLVYWKLGYRNTSATNLDNAITYTLNQSSIYNSGTSEQKIGKAINAYKLSETKGFERYRQHVVEGDLIFMFLRNTLGIHLFGDLGFNYSTKLFTKTGVLNGGVGFIFTVYDQAKEKAKVNIEPFFKLKDINAQTPLSNKYDTWERFSFGIKLGLPFNRVLL